MSTVSPVFLLFVAVGLIIYYCIPAIYAKKAQWVVLLLLSYVFYLAGGVWMVGYLLFTTLSTYLAALCIDKLNSAAWPEKKEKRVWQKGIARRKQLLTAAAILLNFGLLYFLKYWDFTADMLNSATSLSLPHFDLLLPLGISFYMFQSVGYLVDVYRAKYAAQKNPFKYALFVSFFPQMIQGPIGRYDALAPQFFRTNRFNFENLKAGIQLALWGYFKKLLIADRAAVVVNEVYSDFDAYGGLVIFFGVVMYCIQLYCDFSGGIDIIRGVAKMFGIDLAENFNRPFFAISLTDFWRRWHMSLGAWMKDYVFYPLSLSKLFIKIGKFSRRKIGGRFGKILPTSIATFIVYFIIGIWHGASWKYVAFGFWNGALITAALLLEPAFLKLKKSLHINGKSAGYRAFQIIRTTAIILIGRTVTRADGFLSGVEMLKKMILHPIPSQLAGGVLLTLGLQPIDYIIIIIGFAILMFVEISQERGKSINAMLDRFPVALQLAVLAAGFAGILLFGAFSGDYIASEFIYMQY